MALLPPPEGGPVGYTGRPDRVSRTWGLELGIHTGSGVVANRQSPSAPTSASLAALSCDPFTYARVASPPVVAQSPLHLLQRGRVPSHARQSAVVASHLVLLAS